MRNSIRTKLILSIVIPIIIVGIINTFFTFRSNSQMNEAIANIQRLSIEGNERILNADRDFYQALTAAQEMILLDVNDKRYAQQKQFYEDNMKQAYERTMKATNNVLDFFDEHEEIDVSVGIEINNRLYIFKANFDIWQRQVDKQIGNLESGMETESINNLKSFSIARDSLDMIGREIDSMVQQTIEETLQSVERNNSVQISILLVTSLISAVFAFLFSSNIIASIKKLADMMGAVEEGDLTSKADVKGTDEMANLCESFNNMVESTKNLIVEVSDNAEKVENSSETLNLTMREVDRRSKSVNDSVMEIAAVMEETSAATEEVYASSEQIMNSLEILLKNAKNGKDAVSEIEKRAEKMREKAQKSSDAANEMYSQKHDEIIDAIEEGKVVSEIEEMANVIFGISEQTNLLALNAAIEAARAGDSGRGFAVVADEVRKLAEQSSNTVERIQRLVRQVQGAFDNMSETSRGVLDFIDNTVISDYDTLVETGVQYLRDSEFVGGLVDDFTSNTNDIASIMDEVKKAIENVSGSVEEVSASTQQIADDIVEASNLVEGASKTARSQVEISHKLGEKVDEFKI